MTLPIILTDFCCAADHHLMDSLERSNCPRFTRKAKRVVTTTAMMTGFCNASN